jgi:hypothetical protein
MKDETAACAQPIRRTIDDDPYPLSPRPTPLKAILAKLEPPALRPELPSQFFLGSTDPSR